MEADGEELEGVDDPAQELRRGGKGSVNLGAKDVGGERRRGAE